MQGKKRYRPDKDGKDKTLFMAYRRRIVRDCGEDGYITCGICGMPINVSLPYPHPWSLTIDHIKPIAKGGTTSEDNLQPAHFKCNRRKGEHMGITMLQINALREEQGGRPINTPPGYNQDMPKITQVINSGSTHPDDIAKALRGLPQSANWRTD